MYQERVIRKRARFVSSTEPVGSSAYRGTDVPGRRQAPDGTASSKSPMAQLVVKKIMMMLLTILIFDFPHDQKNLLRIITKMVRNVKNKSEPYIAN